MHLALLVQHETSCLTWKILLHFWLKNKFKILLPRTLLILRNLIFMKSAHISKSACTSMLKYSSSHCFINKTILCWRYMACKSIFKAQKSDAPILYLTHLQYMFRSSIQLYVFLPFHSSWNFPSLRSASMQALAVFRKPFLGTMVYTPTRKGNGIKNVTNFTSLLLQLMAQCTLKSADTKHSPAY